MPDPCQNWPCSTTNDRNNSHSIPDDWEKATENGELDSQVNMLGSKDTINSNLNLSSRPIILNQNRIVNQTDKQAFRPKKILQRPKVEETKETSVIKAIPAIISEQELKTSLKSFEQRELEYAEARLRIMGQAPIDDALLELGQSDDDYFAFTEDYDLS